MSNQQRLPHELAEVEARLAAFVPKPSRINRDVLMYRAGQAAAEARTSRQPWALPLFSAVAAAVIAATAALQVARFTSAPAAEHLAETNTIGTAPVADNPTIPVEPTPVVDPEYSAFRWSAQRASLLIARDRALQLSPHRMVVDMAPATDSAGSTPVTNRHLREELLPRRRAGDEGMFPWHWLQPRNSLGEPS